MDFVLEIDGITEPHQRRPGIDIVLPTINFLVALERQPHPAVLGLNKKAVRLELDAVNESNICQINHA